jgi:hypothetical protein
LVAPTEDAAALAFVHTGVVAGRPDNGDALDDIGRAFGRIVYLLDAVDDHDDDIAHGRFNALAAFPDPGARHREAHRLFTDAHRLLTDAFERLDLVPARAPLARALLVDQVARVGRNVLRGPGPAHCSVAAHRGRAAQGAGPVRALVGLGAAGVAVASAGPSMAEGGDQNQRWRDRCDCCDCSCCECCECCECCDCCDCCDCS